MKDLIKTFEFIESERSRLDLTGGLRLNPGRMGVEPARLELPFKSSPRTRYDESTTLTAATWVTTPMSVKEWRGFEAVIKHAQDPDGGGAVVTEDFYRLGDGVDEFWWDGGTWAVAGATDWNTEAEVAANIATFPATAKSIQVIVNLRTNDDRVTPKLFAVKVLYGAVIDHHEDYVIRSLVPDMKANIRAPGRTLIGFSGGTSVVIQDYKPETPYDIKDVESVYNDTADPAHLFDLFDSYNAGTQTVTLSSDPGACNLFIRFKYQPVVAVKTSRDYSEVGKVPSLTIERVRIVNATERSCDDSVINKDAGTAVKVFAPRQGDIEFDVIADTDKIVDLYRLMEEARKYFAQNRFLVSRGMDERFRLWLVDEYEDVGETDASDISSGRLRARIAGAVFFERGSDNTAAPVKRFITTATTPGQPEGHNSLSLQIDVS